MEQATGLLGQATSPAKSSTRPARLVVVKPIGKAGWLATKLISFEGSLCNPPAVCAVTTKKSRTPLTRPQTVLVVMGINKAAVVDGKLALFDRLGGEKSIIAIVDDFTPRVLQDPRVNWPRKDVKRGGFTFRRKSSESVAWNATDENIAILKKHLVQFIVLATGGPVHYEGKEMKSAHAGMRIGNPEFDAVLGDLKASLDRLQIPNREQKEFLSIIESTHPQIVTQR